MTVPNSRGTLRVVWATTAPADATGPTVAEITGGDDLDPYMVADSLTRSLEGDTIPLNRQHTRFNGQIAGGFGGQPVSIQFERHEGSADDVPWELFEFGASGTLFISDSGFTGAETTVNGAGIAAPVAGDRVETWTGCIVNGISPGVAGHPIVTVSFAVQNEPVLKAVVAA